MNKIILLLMILVYTSGCKPRCNRTYVDNSPYKTTSKCYIECHTITTKIGIIKEKNRVYHKAVMYSFMSGDRNVSRYMGTDIIYEIDGKLYGKNLINFWATKYSHLYNYIKSAQLGDKIEVNIINYRVKKRSIIIHSLFDCYCLGDDCILNEGNPNE